MQVVLRLFESRAKGSYFFFTSLARSLLGLLGAPKWSRGTEGVPTNWPDRVGAVGRSLMREKAEFVQI